MRILLLALIIGLTSTFPTSKAQEFDFNKIKSPIIFKGDYKFAYRDPAVVYHNDKFHLFFTLVERASDTGMYLFVAYSNSDDLVHWSFPRKITPKDRNLNYSSPGNIVKFNNEWIMCLQTYPTPNNETWGNATSRIWIMRSKDLVDWSEPEILMVKGDEIPVSEMGRMIDPYLLEDGNEPGKWWCYYKQNGVSMSYSDNLKNWIFVGSANSGENVTVLYKEGQYILFHSPENGIGIKKSSSPFEWGEDEMLITLGQENWPWAQRRLTAATVIDLTDNPKYGKYIMFFHGSSMEGAKPVYNAHNNASLGIAWSADLENWEWPGKK
ncbi:MAG: hypothetical protein KAK04_02820 [Cyclobacteriaceae bacterium]|nr:hypothetical protein [Cyclobacteriaceae bacterium]